jgi:V/A-type H+-transporting ATPase subunit K
MTTIILMLTLSVLALIATGFYLEMQPAEIKREIPNWARGGLGANLLVFVGGLGAMLIFGVNDVMAQTQTATPATDLSVGYGLAIIGIGLPTALATIGAGIAVASVGAASLAVIAEKPEVFGRTLIYLGLGEGIAIYGLVVTILLLGKI